jgi:hypothetical protein
MHIGDRINVQERHTGRSHDARVLSVSDDGKSAVVDFGPAGFSALSNPGGAREHDRRYARIDVASATVTAVLTEAAF